MTEVYHHDDPFICDACKSTGYCRKAKEFVEEQLALDQYQSDIVRKLCNAIPFKTNLFKSKSVLAKKMQNAHEVFRVNDYETSASLYENIMQGNYYHWEAKLGLALSLYFIKDFPKAIAHAQGIQFDGRPDWERAIDLFISQCSLSTKPDIDKMIAECFIASKIVTPI